MPSIEASVSCRAWLMISSLAWSSHSISIPFFRFALLADASKTVALSMVGLARGLNREGLSLQCRSHKTRPGTAGASHPRHVHLENPGSFLMSVAIHETADLRQLPDH